MAENDMGLAALGTSIAGLTDRLSASLPDIVMKGAQIVKAEILQRAPAGTGALASALDVQVTRRALSSSATVQIEHSGPGGLNHEAIYQEFGTAHQPASPFFRPGVEAASAQVDDLLATEIINVIQQP